MTEIPWGLPVIMYLFLGGMGAGAFAVSSSILLRGGGGFGKKHFELARYGALLAPIPLIIGTALIIFELGTFHAAIEHGNFALMFRWINLFMTFNLSPMNVGSWLLGACIIASVVYAYTFLDKKAGPDDKMSSLRLVLAVIGVPLGIGVGVYTGILLGAMPSRPFWNSPAIAIIFLMSSLSTGVAGILILKIFFDREDSEEAVLQAATPTMERDNSKYLLTVSDLLLLSLEATGVIMLILFAYMASGDRAYALTVILPGGSLFMAFWFGVVLLGLLVPIIIQLKYTFPTLLQGRVFAMQRSLEFVMATVVLLGAFLLRYVVVVAGQITRLIGI